MKFPDDLQYTLLSAEDALLLRRCRNTEESLRGYQRTLFGWAAAVTLVMVFGTAAGGFSLHSFIMGQSGALGLCALTVIPQVFKRKFRRTRKEISARSLTFKFVDPELEEEKEALNDLRSRALEYCQPDDEPEIREVLCRHFRAGSDLLNVVDSDDRKAALGIYRSARLELENVYKDIRALDEKRAIAA